MSSRSRNRESRTGTEATVTCLPEPQLAILRLTIKYAVIEEVKSHVGLMVPFITDKKKSKRKQVG